MPSSSFRRALRATGFIDSSGQPVPGLTLRECEGSSAWRMVFRDKAVDLRADALFCAQSTPVSVFKDAGHEPPQPDQIRNWHEAAWNIGTVPLLWIITPTEVRLYNCYASPPAEGVPAYAGSQPLDKFPINTDDGLRTLNAACGRLATETGAFWTSAIGKRIDRRHRVDRELLAEIDALQRRLTSSADCGDGASREALSLELAQRLIGRCIFTWYLLDREVAQPFLPKGLGPTLPEMLATRNSAFKLFDFLQTTFNGDLFPMDDPGAERASVTEQHLEPLRSFVEGQSLVHGMVGQGRLFRFRFDAIPIELISSIYQQFAQSSAAEAATAQGLHYTPVELVHLVVDPVLEGLPPNARVLDPACGSGVFLVEAFRRLVWRSTSGARAPRQLVRRILREQLFGIDINRSALGIAAFSLYLAALELDGDPVNDIKDLRFDRLIDRTLFEADTTASTLPDALTSQPFDAIVGNPPWTFVSRPVGAPNPKNKGVTGPRRSPDHKFLSVAGDLAGDHGHIGMVMKATPFFSIDEQAVDYRRTLLERLKPTALINLSQLRREGLFPKGTGPALLFFSRCELSTDSNLLLGGSIPWSPDFRRTGVFQVDASEIQRVSLRRALKFPASLKAAVFGTVRDRWLMDRLFSECESLDSVLTEVGVEARTHRGQGFRVSGTHPPPSPPEYFALRVLKPTNFRAFRISSDKLKRFDHATLGRARRRSIFRGPMVICPQFPGSSRTKHGRYAAAIAESDILYNESHFGISFADADLRIAHVLSGILNSSMVAFQLAIGGPTWGLERPQVKPQALLALRIPSLRDADPRKIEAVTEAEGLAADHPEEDDLAMLDTAVFDLYGLDEAERVLVSESLERTRFLLSEGHTSRRPAVAPPDRKTLLRYGRQVVRTVDAYLRALGVRHLECVTYPEPVRSDTAARRIPGAAAVRFAMEPGRPGREPVIREGRLSDLDALKTELPDELDANPPPYLNERRHLRMYRANDLFILKPAETRCWTRVAALNDADLILADHWSHRF